MPGAAHYVERVSEAMSIKWNVGCHALRVDTTSEGRMRLWITHTSKRESRRSKGSFGGRRRSSPHWAHLPLPRPWWRGDPPSLRSFESGALSWSMSEDESACT